MKAILELADKYKDLRDRKSDLNAELKELNKVLEQTERTLADAMVDDEVQSFDRSGSKFYLSTRTYVSPKADQKDTLMAWLKEEGYGDLVKETVHPQTLASFVRELADEAGLPEDLEEMLNIFDKTGVNVRRA